MTFKTQFCWREGMFKSVRTDRISQVIIDQINSPYLEASADGIKKIFHGM